MKKKAFYFGKGGFRNFMALILAVALVLTGLPIVPGQYIVSADEAPIVFDVQFGGEDAIEIESAETEDTTSDSEEDSKENESEETEEDSKENESVETEEDSKENESAGTEEDSKEDESAKTEENSKENESKESTDANKETQPAKTADDPAALALLAGIAPLAATPSAITYESLDPNPSEEIEFDGSEVKWNGKSWTLDDTTIFIDYRLSEDQLKAVNGADGSKGLAFRSLQEAKFGMELSDGTEYTGGLKNGTAAKRMTILTAPGVYWIDAPYDPDGTMGYPISDNYIRPQRDPSDPEGGSGSNQSPLSGTPYGMTLPYQYLSFVGLNSNKFNVVFASARGQTNGSNGNYTMFRVTGRGAAGAINTENVTFGNFTNANLDFPLDSVLPAGEKLSVRARTQTIVQAQLFSGGGDGLAVNTAFISRLNLLPLSAKLYVDCYIESSGHSGGGSTYINSELHFFNVNFNGGSNFYNSDIYLEPFSWNIDSAMVNPGKVYEAGLGDNTTSTGIMVDVRIHRGDVLKNVTGEGIGPEGMHAGYSWADKDPKSPASRSYQYNVTFDYDGNEMKPYVIQEYKTPGVTVEMDTHPDLLGAYRLDDGQGNVYYNLQNIVALADFSGSNALYKELGDRYPNLDVDAFNALEAAAESAGYYRTIPRRASIARATGYSFTHNTLVNQVLGHIHTNFAGNIDLGELATSLGVTASHLARTFKKYMNGNFQCYEKLFKTSGKQIMRVLFTIMIFF